MWAITKFHLCKLKPTIKHFSCLWQQYRRHLGMPTAFHAYFVCFVYFHVFSKLRSRYTVVCRVAKFGCARHCVIYTNQLLAVPAVYSIKTTGPILTKITFYMAYSLFTLCMKVGRNRPRYAVPKVARISSYFLLRKTL